MPLRPLGNDSSLPCLSPDLDGVQLFRIHCQAAAVVRLCLRTGPLVFSSRGSKSATSAPGEWSVFALPEPGCRWCSAVSNPLPQAAAVVRLCGLGCVTFFANVLGLFSFPLAFLKVPLRPLGNVRFLLCLSPDLDAVQLFRIHCHAAAVVRLCLHTGTLFCSSRRSKDVTSAPGEWSFFALPEPGFRWCSAVSDPLSSGCRCAFVRSRSRHVFC